MHRAHRRTSGRGRSRRCRGLAPHRRCRCAAGWRPARCRFRDHAAREPSQADALALEIGDAADAFRGEQLEPAAGVSGTRRRQIYVASNLGEIALSPVCSTPHRRTYRKPRPWVTLRAPGAIADDPMIDALVRGSVRRPAHAACSVKAGAARARPALRMTSFSPSTTRKKMRPPRNSRGQIHSGIASVSKRS
jgi:hypothetical protein